MLDATKGSDGTQSNSSNLDAGVPKNVNRGGRTYQRLPSEYKNIEFTPGVQASAWEEGKDATLKIKKNKVYMDIETKKITKFSYEKTYTYSKGLGQGTFGKVGAFQEDGGVKSKALKEANIEKIFGTKSEKEKTKIVKDELSKGYKVLQKLHVDPNTGKHLPDIPGLMPEYKFNENGIALMSAFEGDLEGYKFNDLNEAKNATAQLLYGLSQIHSEGKYKKSFVAGDIKDKNILFRTKNGVKQFVLSDLDGARPAGKKGHLTETAMTACYEDHKNADKVDKRDISKFELSQDIYKLGITLRGLIGLEGDKVTIEKGNTNELFKYSRDGKMLDILMKNKDNYEETELRDYFNLCSLIDHMTNPDWSLRPTAEGALAHLQTAGFINL